MSPFILHPSSFVLLLFMGGSLTAAAFGGQSSPTAPVQMTLGGVGAAAAASATVAEVTLTGAQAGLGAIGLAATLIGYHFVFGKYIREQAGVKETHATTISGQPIVVKGVTPLVNHDQLDERLGNYVTTGALHDTERRLDGKIDQNFRALDEKRSHSIRELHEHITGSMEKLTDRIEQSAQRASDREEKRIVDLHAKVDSIALRLTAKGGRA